MGDDLGVVVAEVFAKEKYAKNMMSAILILRPRAQVENVEYMLDALFAYKDLKEG